MLGGWRAGYKNAAGPASQWPRGELPGRYHVVSRGRVQAGEVLRKPESFGEY